MVQEISGFTPNLKFKGFEMGLKELFDVVTLEFERRLAIVQVSEGVFCSVPWDSVVQFTGYNDFHGVDIYDGHIITNKSRNGGEPHLVKWSKRYGSWVGCYGELEYSLAIDRERGEHVSIVGHRFTHKNLIKEI